MAAFFAFSLLRRRASRKLLACAVLLPGLAACTTATPLVAAKPMDQTASTASYGTIVSMRVIRSGTPLPDNGPDIRVAILGAINGFPGALPVAASPGEQAVEFIVDQEGGGQPVSVMQTNDARLHTGERVLVTRGARTHISRVGV